MKYKKWKIKYEKCYEYEKLVTIFEFFIVCAKLCQVTPFPSTNFVGYEILQAELMSGIKDANYSMIPADEMQSHEV